MGKKAIEVAEQVGCLDAVGDTLNIVGTAELRQGNLDGPGQAGPQPGMAEQAGDEIGVVRAYMHPAAALAARREWVLAERYIEPGLVFCRERGLDALYGWLTTLAAEAALAQGRWAEAVSTAAEILAWPAEGFGAVPCHRAGGHGHGSERGAASPDTGRCLTRRPCSPRPSPPRAGRSADRRAAGGGRVAGGGGAAADRGGDLVRGRAGPDVTRWFAGDVEVWRHRAGLDCGDPAELPEPYRLEITGDADGAARWWQERGCGYDAALALACSGDRGPMRRALDMLHELGAQPAAAVVARRLRALGRTGLAPRPPAGHRGEPGGPDQPRGGSADASGRRAGQPGDRRAAGPLRPNRRQPRVGDIAQARRPHPRRGQRAGSTAGLGQTATTTAWMKPSYPNPGDAPRRRRHCTGNSMALSARSTQSIQI